MIAQPKIAEPTVVNGIDVDDLFSLIEGVKQNPAKGKTSWRVTTTWRGQARSRAQIEGFGIGGQRVPRRFSIDIDEPCELGGTNRFANPQEHLLAALNACMTVGYVAQCAVRGIALNAWRLNRRRDRSPRLPRDRSCRAAGLRDPALRRPHQGQRDQGAVRPNPRCGDGDLTQLPQRIAAHCPQADPHCRSDRRRRVV